ncbi:MAG: metallophosphoesterase [Spirochaetota bacterium]|nr:metallophosphoesterase [Spirochaetota bacterium]
MKVLYTSDLHVDGLHYKRLYNLVKENIFDCLIIGGDLIPNKPDFFGSVDNQRDFLEKSFKPFFSKLKSKYPTLSVYLMMGNDDRAANMDILERMEQDGIINLIHKKLHQLEKDLYLIGYGYVPITPFRCKDWERFDTNERVAQQVPERSFFSSSQGLRQIDINTDIGKFNSIEEDIKDLAEMSDPKRTIYVMHAPPFNTALDRIHGGIPCGSKSIKGFVEKHQPLLTLHGHIHESPNVSGNYIEKTGRTVSINPGQSHGVLHAIAFNTEDLMGTLQYYR